MSSQCWHIMTACNACCHNLFIINDTLVNNQTHPHGCLMASRSPSQHPHLELMHLANSFLLVFVHFSSNFDKFSFITVTEKGNTIIKYKLGKNVRRASAQKMKPDVLVANVNTGSQTSDKSRYRDGCTIATGFYP